MTSILKVSEIQDPTNSNTALMIDSSGIVSTSQLQYITLLRNASVTYSAGATIADWRLAESNGITESSGVCTVSVAGVYLVSLSVISDATNGIEFFYNGTKQFRVGYGAIGSGEAFSTVGGCFAWSLSASDTVHFRAQGSMGIYGASDNTTVGYWSMVKIG
jgi:hypothetical protein